MKKNIDEKVWEILEGYNSFSIAIDGPSGAGKSTLSRYLAEQFGFIYVDTGALYRAVGLRALSLGLNTRDEKAVESSVKGLEVYFKYVEGEQRVFMNGEDVSDDIRTPEVSMAASDVSAFPLIRSFLFDLQKNAAVNNKIVMDGRDIGTVVLPLADIKIFLTATPEDRANRRYEELLEKGKLSGKSYDEILSEVKERDYNDSNRKTAPLKRADDAVLLDTTGGALEESMARLVNLVEQLILKKQK